MKRLQKLLTAALIAVLVVGGAGCSDNSDKPVGELVQAWTVGNTEKILLDKVYDDSLKTAKTLKMEMAKGEYEGAQLILTALEDITDLDVSIGDLSSGDSVIAAGNIEVLFEKYVNIEAMSSPLAQADLGYYPDALVPIDAIKNAGENKIAQGQNQGIWIKVRTPYDCASGTYTGMIKVTVNAKSMSVPMSVKVWNFAVSKTTHMKTAFNNFREYLIGGELDNTPAMYEKYFDFFLDYRISLCELPNVDASVESFVAAAKKYAADDRCASYSMRFEYLGQRVIDGVTITNETDWANVKAKLTALAESSDTDLNLLSKLYFYDQSIDEPIGTNRIPDANYKMEKFLEILDEVVAELDDENFDWTSHGLEREDMLKIEYVVTTAYQQDLEGIRSYCPMVDAFKTAQDRARYESIRDEDPYNTTWWYACWTPQYPYPNYRIEESALGGRVMSWMQMEYDITGLLYWGTSVYAAMGNPGGTRPRDPYNDPYSFQRITADGYLSYPGRPYKLDAPVSSMRLESLRDGIEDYEYLYALRDKLGEIAAEYQADIDFDAVMNPLYASLYTEVIPSYISENLVSARREVAEMLELLDTQSKAIAYVSATDVVTNKATLKIYANKDTEVSIDGKTLSGASSGENGKVYLYDVNLADTQNVTVTFQTGNEIVSANKYIGKSTNLISLVKDNTVNVFASNGTKKDPKEHIVLSKNTSDFVGKNGIKAEIAKYESLTDAIGAKLYRPELIIEKKNGFPNVSVDKFNTLEFDIYNAAAEVRELKVYFQAQSQQKLFGTFTLKSGINRIKIQQIAVNNWANLASADRIVLSLPQCAGDNPDIYYIDNMFYTLSE